jgi:hypothetical protein
MLGGQNKCLFRCVIKVEIVAVVDGVRGKVVGVSVVVDTTRDARTVFESGCAGTPAFCC